MQSTESYRHILKLDHPGSVKTVELDMEADQNRETKLCHPETKEPATAHYWTTTFQWRHLDNCQSSTVIEAKVTSVKYRDGSIKEIVVPRADHYQRFTKLLAKAAIMWLQACGNVDRAVWTVCLDWQSVNRIMERAEERGLFRREDEPISKVGVNEKSFRQGYVYASILTALDNRLADEVRKEEYQGLMSVRDEPLKESKCLWLKNFTDLRWERSYLEHYNANLKISKDWGSNDAFAGFWDYIIKFRPRSFLRLVACGVANARGLGTCRPPRMRVLFSLAKLDLTA